MTRAPVSVLFLCTGNSARSLMAEVLLNELAGRYFRGYSAGAKPTGKVHPLTLAVLSAAGHRTEVLRSKGWNEFTGPEAPPVDAVVTVCDDAASEPCPVWPGRPATLHWSLPDPAAALGTEEERIGAFRRAYEDIRRRIEGVLARLPSTPASRGDLVRALKGDE